ncbi:MAG: hypothetical protein IJ680_03210 [Paludibacteraceae bacterium]|nr:hypothetical protein [Paludibacteraceae bacterium]
MQKYEKKGTRPLICLLCLAADIMDTGGLMRLIGLRTPSVLTSGGVISIVCVRIGR